MSDLESIHLLILDDSENDAERLVSLLRNSGKATRPHRVASEEAWLQALKNQPWDLIYAKEKAGDCKAIDALMHLQRLEKDTPFILLLDDYNNESHTKGLEAGAFDVVPSAADKRLLLVSTRELDNLVVRRQRRRSEVGLKEAERRGQSLLDSSVDAVAYVLDGMHIYANPAYVRLFGYDEPDDLAGLPIMDLVSQPYQADLKKFLQNYKPDSTDNCFDFELVHADGAKMDAELALSPANYDGEECIQVVVRVAADNKELEEKLKLLASQDLLTGLLNRSYFLEKLEHNVEQARNAQHSSAMFYIGLDNFGGIKSDIGISDADLLIADIAMSLQAHIGEEYLLARFGDEAFTLLWPNDDMEKAEKFAQNICKQTANHLFEIAGKTLQISLSIGIAAIGDTTPDADIILTRCHNATDSLRDNADNKGNGVKIHTQETTQVEELIVNQTEKSGMQLKLEKALKENRFKLLFQPVVSLHGEVTEHYEVLLRMLDEEGQEVSPNEFMAAADELNFVEKIDRWVILQVLKLLAQKTVKSAATRLTVNISKNTIGDETFLAWYSKALKAARVGSDRLILQFSETDAATYLKQAKRFSLGLAELHGSLCLNRFGGSLHPFNTLKHIKVDYIKLDGSFTRDLVSSKEQQENLKNMIASLQAKGKLTIVPRVETAPTLATLWQLGANYVQGNYMAEASDEMDFDFSEDA